MLAEWNNIHTSPSMSRISTTGLLRALQRTAWKDVWTSFIARKTIYWDFTETIDKQMPVDRNDPNTKQAVTDLTVSLFKSIQERLIKHCLLKFYNFFLVPIQSELWAVVQGSITSLPDASLEQKFEVEAMRDKIKNEQSKLKKDVQYCVTNEPLLTQASDIFSHKMVFSGMLRE
eukprot:TRINITY_DN3637_c0_g1_i4.p1 TRINITY_DN3637_c0_g1~~TRINITY_DN3637_c0_g1_i4.p1  ORF type:complete len:174 (-),score=36.63 TRINITY_DN3637_c0_g1_i4:122-643(-)